MKGTASIGFCKNHGAIDCKHASCALECGDPFVFSLRSFRSQAFLEYAVFSSSVSCWVRGLYWKKRREEVLEQLSTAIFVRMNNEHFQATYGLQVTSNDQRLTFSLQGLLIWSVSNGFDKRVLKSDSFLHRFCVIPCCISVIQSTCNFHRQNSKQHARAALAKQAAHRQLAYHSCINANWFSGVKGPLSLSSVCLRSCDDRLKNLSILSQIGA